ERRPTKPAAMDGGRGEPGRFDEGARVAAQVASLEDPAPRATNAALEPPARAPGRRGGVLDEPESAARTEDPPKLGAGPDGVVDRAEHERADHLVDAGIWEGEPLAAGAEQLEIDTAFLRAATERWVHRFARFDGHDGRALREV